MFRPQNYDYFCSWQPCFRSGWQYRLRHKAQFFSMRAVLATRFSKNACGNGLPVSNDRRNIPVYVHPEYFNYCKSISVVKILPTLELVWCNLCFRTSESVYTAAAV